MNRQRHAIDQTMRHADWVDWEAPRLEALSGLHFTKVRAFQQSMLIKLVFHVGQGEFRSPHRHFQFGENPGERADVIFMAVRKNDSAHPLSILDEVGDIGNNDVDAQQLSFGEHQTRINHDNIVAPADRHAVHTELAEAPQGDNLQFSSWHGVLLMLADYVAERTE